MTRPGRARPWVSAQWPCSLGGEELAGRRLSQEEALDPTGHTGRAPEPASFCTFYLTCFPWPLPPRPQGAQPGTHGPGKCRGPPGGDVPWCPFPQTHTQLGESRRSQGSGTGSVCGLGEERPPLPSQRCPERVPGQRPGAGPLGPGGWVIRSQRESPARALEDGLGAGEPRSPPGAGCVAPYTLHRPPWALHSPPGFSGEPACPSPPYEDPSPTTSSRAALGPPSGTPPRAGPGPAPGPIRPLQGPSPHQVSGEGAQGPPGHPIQRGWRPL